MGESSEGGEKQINVILVNITSTSFHKHTPEGSSTVVGMPHSEPVQMSSSLLTALPGIRTPSGQLPIFQPYYILHIFLLVLVTLSLMQVPV